MTSAHRTNGKWLVDEEAARWRRWQGWTALVLGAWLVAASSARPYTVAAAAAGEIACIVGALLVLMSGLTRLAGHVNEELRVTVAVADLALGLFLLVSPWEFGYADAAVPTVTAVAVGTLLILLCAFLDPSAE